MAVAVRQLDNNYVYTGSAMRVYTHKAAQRVEEQPTVHRDTGKRTKAANNAKAGLGLAQQLIVTCLILAVAAAVLMVLVRYSIITEQYAVVNDYKATIEENQRTLKELEVRLNSAVSLDAAREAALEAGLGYPTASQIVIIDG